MLVRATAILALGLGATCPSLAQCEMRKFIPPPPGANLDRLGRDVALLGDWAAVGTDTGTKSSATMFRRMGHEWFRTQKIVFGGTSSSSAVVAMSRDVLLISDINHEKVGLYTRTGDTWALTQTLTATPDVAGSQFGLQLAIDGDRLAITAPMDDSVPFGRGSAFIFERVAGVWIQTAKIMSEVPGSYGFFGRDMDLDGDTLVVVNPETNLNQVNVFRLTAGLWQVEARWRGPFNVGFGSAVAIEGDRIAVGANKDFSHGGPNGGSVTLYERQGSWVQVGRIHVDGAEDGDGFGSTVVLHGDHILTGSSNKYSIQLGAAAHLHRWGAGWPLEGSFFPHDYDNSPHGTGFGNALALDDDTIVVGSPLEGWEAGIKGAGAAYFYTREELTEAYCSPANVNSLGVSGLLESEGCPTLAENDLHLLASQLPPDRLGVFLFSRERDMLPFFNGNQGNLCLGGVIGRFSDQVRSSGPAGELQLIVDLSNLPIAGSGQSAARGETWNFQCWYRDQNPGPTSNLTSALAVSIR